MRGSPSSNTTSDATTSVPMHVADVDTLDAQRRFRQTQRILNALQRSGSRGEVACALELVLSQRILGIALHGFGERTLVAALRDPQRYPRSP